MSFAEELKNEIIGYQNSLDEFDAIDKNEVNSILEKAVQKKRDVYTRTVVPLENELEQLDQALDVLEKHEHLSFEIKSSIFSMYERHVTKERRMEIDRIIQGKYKELLGLRKDIQEILRGKVLTGEKNLPQNDKLLREQIQIRKTNVYSQLNDSYLELTQYMDSIEKKVIVGYWMACVSVSTRVLADNAHMYPNLLRLMTISALDNEFAQNAPALNENFSIVCQELYQNICNDIAKRKDSNSYDIFDVIELPFYVEKEGKNVFLYESSEFGTKECYRIIKGTFLKDLFKELENNPNINLPDLASNIRNKYVTEAIDDKLKKSLIEFKRLYEETPERILITEQRYYREKELEQQQKAAELHRKELAKQAARDRKNALRIAQMEEQREQQREVQERRNRIEQERKDKLERDRQYRAEVKERHEKSMADAKARQEAMHLCWRCANYGHGCHGGIPACGNFRPKR